VSAATALLPGMKSTADLFSYSCDMDESGCDGSGKTEDGGNCSTCKGTGTVRVDEKSGPFPAEWVFETVDADRAQWAAKVEKLTKALGKFGCHHPNCGAEELPDADDCDCGLAAALAGGPR
jgi:hypothetical protein